jgi:hypothetical protein
MTNKRPRFLLAASAVILAAGSVLHAALFPKANLIVSASNLPAFYAKVLRSFWFMDSAVCLILAVTFALIAARPVLAGGVVLILLALIPAATAALLYVFLGLFPPAHVLVAAAVLTILAGLQWPRP